MTDQTRRQEKVEAPELGADVMLMECNVDELLPLFEIAQAGDSKRLMLATLAASLWVDGERWSEKDIRALPASKFRPLMELGAKALRINSIIPDDEDAESKNA